MIGNQGEKEEKEEGEASWEMNREAFAWKHLDESR